VCPLFPRHRWLPEVLEDSPGIGFEPEEKK
jgi:NADH:ubiquinone oxidoreductase subunit 4 (subunit M)